MTSIIISASILSADFTKLGQELSIAETAGVDWFHVDVMDGQFVPNISMGPFIVEACRRITDLPLDVHLMIEHPEKHIEAFAHAGAESITIHIERNPNIFRTLQEIRSLGCRTGVALNPGTPAASISEVLPIVDRILVMTVNPGFSGQEFLAEVVPKITQISTMIQEINPAVQIQVDGGVSKETILTLYKAGARLFVAATAIFKYSGGIQEGVKLLRKAVK
ncbi:MAG: ribulose-phosphate 3-epimerase [Anaerolineaceae bacterium]|nr:ribulose-phosphate 3-epimerase [Anaerolineaceae bacterium]